MRRDNKVIKVGDILIGGRNRISIQSMTNTDTRDVEATIKQIKSLEKAGCDIVRVAVLDLEAAKSISKIKSNINIPLVADIHFNYKLAIEAVKSGADKVRINPGNIGSEERIKEVVDVVKNYNIPIRIGVNSGSVEKSILQKYGKVSPEVLVESAKKHVSILERYNFNNIIISIKASDVVTMVNANKLAADTFDYPLHLGVTEAGTVKYGTIKSSVGIGALLLEGIGDTIRVSLTGDPVEEVFVAKQILKVAGCISEGVELVSCPTCGRCRINLIKIANEVEKRLLNVNKDIKVAVMGCEVNGPGEAKDADIGIAGGNGYGIIFKKGKVIEKVTEDDIINKLFEHINTI